MTPLPPPERRSTLMTLVAVLLLAAAVGMLLLPRRSFDALGKEAPGFSLPLLVGGEPGDRVSLQALRGKVVVLDFWASWCGPCRQQARTMEAFARGLPSDVALVGIATQDERPAAAAFARSQGAAYPSVYDDAGVAGAYGVTSLPTLVVVAPDGTIADYRHGAQSEAALEEMVEAARQL